MYNLPTHIGMEPGNEAIREDILQITTCLHIRMLHSKSVTILA